MKSQVIKVTDRSPEQLIVSFPGGHLELSRCSDGTYWAHIARARADNQPPQWVGQLLSGRMDSDGPDANGPITISDPNIYHVALHIATDPKRKAERQS